MINFYSNDLSFSDFVIITSSIPCILVYFGLIGLIESFMKVNFLWKLFALSSIWFSGIDLSFGHLDLISTSGMFMQNVFSGPKYSVNLCITVLIFMLAREKLYEAALYGLLLLGFSTVVGLPGVIVT